MGKKNRNNSTSTSTSSSTSNSSSGNKNKNSGKSKSKSKLSNKSFPKDESAKGNKGKRNKKNKENKNKKIEKDSIAPPISVKEKSPKVTTPDSINNTESQPVITIKDNEEKAAPISLKERVIKHYDITKVPSEIKITQPLQISIIGAGPVGTLIALQFAKRGHMVDVYERRKDSRKVGVVDGLSINLALSYRGIEALKSIDPKLSESIIQKSIPMYGRWVNKEANSNIYLYMPYDIHGAAILSVGRQFCTEILMNWADEYYHDKIKFHFEHNLKDIDLENDSKLTFILPNGSIERPPTPPDMIIGADGSSSAARKALIRHSNSKFRLEKLDEFYKEFIIPSADSDISKYSIFPDKLGSFRLKENVLTIWARGNKDMMLITLPNYDGSYTGTFFGPKGAFEDIDAMSKEEFLRFFESYPDILNSCPDLYTQYCEKSIGKLATVRLEKWYTKNLVLLGDAAHGLVPFFGQGMNCGMEDTRVFAEIFDKYQGSIDSLADIFKEYEKIRKPDGTTIQNLSLANYEEMRNKVRHNGFRITRWVHQKLHKLFPNVIIPRYSLVAFHPEVRFSEIDSRLKRSNLIVTSLFILTSTAIVGGAAFAFKKFKK